jgi:hypothetical protein
MKAGVGGRLKENCRVPVEKYISRKFKTVHL